MYLALSGLLQKHINQITEGQSNSQVASALYLSLNTIKSHVNSILNKLGVNDRVQAAVFVVRNHLL
jgi:DNA-binding NarL/FixJ family response regulator